MLLADDAALDNTGQDDLSHGKLDLGGRLDSKGACMAYDPADAANAALAERYRSLPRSLKMGGIAAAAVSRACPPNRNECALGRVRVVVDGESAASAGVANPEDRSTRMNRSAQLRMAGSVASGFPQ